MPTVHLVVPDSIADPGRPSGGNEYDRRLAEELRRAGWTVREHLVPGSWPRPGASAVQAVGQAVAALPDGAVVLVDGLIAAAGRAALVPAADRLRVVPLVHMLFSDPQSAVIGASAATDEAAVFAAATAIVTTSGWARDRVVALHPAVRERVHVAPPGTEPAPVSRPSLAGDRLLFVGAIAPHKGPQVLLTALAGLLDRPWTCELIGPERDGFAGALRRQAADAGVADRVGFRGPMFAAELARAYGNADLLVHPSLAETYGMVVTEALARAVPVIGSDVGGLPEALGTSPGGRPGLLVAPGDAAALGAALRVWLIDPALRSRLRAAALARRATLDDWAVTAARVAQALTAAGGRR